MSKTEPDSLKHGRGPGDDRGVVEARIVAPPATPSPSMASPAPPCGRSPATPTSTPLSCTTTSTRRRPCRRGHHTAGRVFRRASAGGHRSIAERAEAILRNAIHQWEQPETAAALRSIFLTAAHEPSTLEKLRQTLSLSLMAAVAAELPGEARMLRASLVGTQVIGLVMIRYVWKIDPVASLGDDEVLALVGPGVQRYLSGELATT